MSLVSTLQTELDQMSAAGTLKRELLMKSPQGAVVDVEGIGEVIMLTSNNYLGLADHPAIIEASEKGERDYGYGLASVRFICGTQTIHRQLEERIAAFFGTEDFAGSYVYVINADGTGLRRVVMPHTTSLVRPAWSPDGTRLLYEAEPDYNHSEIRSVKLDGTDDRVLTSALGSTEFPAWTAASP